MSKGLEALERIKPYADSTIRADCEIIEKELKALEIIKEKRVNCYDIINSVDYKHYLVLTKDYHKDYILTQEEYDLLKEVLL